MYAALPDFQHSLAKWLVAQAAAQSPAVTLVYNTTGDRSLWLNRAVEGVGCASRYTVLRNYPGPGGNNDPLPRASYQVKTTGPASVVLARSYQILACMLNADGTAARMIEIDGFKAADDSDDGHWRIVEIDFLQRPGLIETDEKGRGVAAFNFDIGFTKLD